MQKEYRPSLAVSLIILVFMILCMSVGVGVFQIPIHMALIIVGTVSVVVLMVSGASWDSITSAIEQGGKLAWPPLLLLYVIGMMVGIWVASGTVPFIIYWGLKLINPSFFLLTVVIISAIVSIATGSSWSTAGTVGVAMMGVGAGLDINPAMTAGAIISGAYMGDKMSPLSDTTNLAPAVAEADLFDHIKAMVYTTTPGFIITLIFFTVLGLNHSGEVDSAVLNEMLSALENNFNLNPITILPAIIILVFSIKKVPSLITLVVATLTGAIIAMVLQGADILSIIKIMDSGYVSETGMEDIDVLLTRGGFQSMNWTASLAMLGITLGAILEKNGVLGTLLNQILKRTSSVGGLVTATILGTISLNIITASQYTSIVIGGRMFIPGFKKFNMLPQTLSRSLEDSGTITSPLVPWNTCAAYMTGALGVATGEYMPYAIFCWVVPIISITFAWLNKFQWKTGDIPSKRVYDTQE